jgi:hypothetical protein
MKNLKTVAIFVRNGIVSEVYSKGYVKVVVNDYDALRENPEETRLAEQAWEEQKKELIKVYG